MNQVFRLFLRKFVIVFFDDILVYSRSLDEHMQHLHLVLNCLMDNSFFAKGSKCTFFQQSIEYLGHLVSAEGVRADPSKVEAMTEWPQPKNIKQLRGFLGLTGYYRRFVSHYATLAAPLTELLKKNNFVWSEKTIVAFERLKQAMLSTPVLRLPDFTKTFVVETDASNVGIGGILMQDGHPLSFFSKKFGPRMIGASTYLRELQAVVEAVSKWRQYILGRHFIIRTDHKSLKELLTQVIQTPEQQHYLRKLMGFHFTIEYKAGAENTAADALSRRFELHSSQYRAAISAGQFDFLQTLKKENLELHDLQ